MMCESEKTHCAAPLQDPQGDMTEWERQQAEEAAEGQLQADGAAAEDLRLRWSYTLPARSCRPCRDHPHCPHLPIALIAIASQLHLHCLPPDTPGPDYRSLKGTYGQSLLLHLR